MKEVTDPCEKKDLFQLKQSRNEANLQHPPQKSNLFVVPVQRLNSADGT